MNAPAADDGRVHPAVVVAVAALGVALVALPWIPMAGPMPFEGEIPGASEAFRRLRAVAAHTDAAVARGDVAALRDSVTDSCWDEIRRISTGAGRQLGSETLKEQRFLVGELESMPFLYGAARDGRAVLVFAWGGHPEVAGPATRPTLLAVRFRWDGYDFRFDAKRSVTLEAGDERAARARAWGGELLE